MGQMADRAGRWCLTIIIGWTLLGWSQAAAATPPSTGENNIYSTGDTENPPGVTRRFKSRNTDLNTSFSMSLGVRNDDFNWSIAGNASGTNPNILSELDWSKLDSYQLRICNRTQVGRLLYFRAQANYAWIQDGTVRDSDYHGDNHTDEYSRSISQSSGDQLWDLSFGAGYPFVLSSGRLRIAPLIGLSISKQNFRITDGYQVVGAGPPETPEQGPLDSRLNSTYRAKWVGPWVGCDLRYRLNPGRPGQKPMELGVTLELHWVDYSAQGNWNLRNDLEHPVSFEHQANGFGIQIELEWLIHLAHRWDLNLTAGYQHWSTDPGKNTQHNTSGTYVSRLNEVDWEAHSFMVGVIYHFIGII
jgi:Protochlamydia outer membrane protein